VMAGACGSPRQSAARPDDGARAAAPSSCHRG
jgi:hypothetical protein